MTAWLPRASLSLWYSLTPLHKTRKVQKDRLGPAFRGVRIHTEININELFARCSTPRFLSSLSSPWDIWG
ncbi:hypothetical protein JTE90_005686 [Oedothorax gibbosus]|uniref:Uncharacterized protein n=1 Tax=Oedothorax gibbosus TaxID=931172 RepID=A0AAV6TD79_9ARAC|nr:hypothetical protein JTE90_005686 [Oedothorax gibbosus]